MWLWEKGNKIILILIRCLKNHGAFIQSLEPYSNVQRDSLFKQKAFTNIKEYPLKYLQNTAASTLRLFFNYPFSYTQQKPSSYFYILPNMFLIVFLSFAGYLAFFNVRFLPFEIRFIALFSLIYIGGIILLNGRVRHLITHLSTSIILYNICLQVSSGIQIKETNRNF